VTLNHLIKCCFCNFLSKTELKSMFTHLETKLPKSKQVFTHSTFYYKKYFLSLLKTRHKKSLDKQDFFYCTICKNTS